MKKSALRTVDREFERDAPDQLLPNESQDGDRGSQPPRKRRLQKAADVAQILTLVVSIIATYAAVNQLQMLRSETAAQAERLQMLHRQTAAQTVSAISETTSSESFQGHFEIFNDMEKPILFGAFEAKDAQGKALRNIANFYEAVAISVYRNDIEYDLIKELLRQDVLTFWKHTAGAIKQLQVNRKNPKIFANLERLAQQFEQDGR